MRRTLTSLALLTFLAAAPGAAQEVVSGEGPSSTAASAAVRAEEYSGRAGDLFVPSPFLETAEISVDGRMDEAHWGQAAILTAFTQYEPNEGVAASQETEVRVLVDSDAIYFGILAREDEPGGIRATLGERDSFTRSDDYVRLVLDTFDDQRRAYVFSVNPLGVQHDGIWNEGGSSGRRGGFGPPIDNNPDFLWESDAELTDEGYRIEVRIPFKSLRFPEVSVQDWGLQVTRRIQRNGYESSWAPITQDAANRLTQSGKLTGLQELDPGMFLEINPVLTGNRFGERDEDTDVFGHDAARGAFGLNATYGLTSNLTLDATYNPDFSQVEADAGQISVNERFAIFFPEKRPFFLEGTEIFGMPKQLVYTRTVANPIGGAKLTGKVGSLQMGYIGAVDEGLEDDAPTTLVNLMRVRKDVGASSTVGAVYTDRTVDSEQFNRVLGADARFVLGGRYTLTLMGAASRTADPEVATTQGGELLNARFERSGRSFSFNVEFEDTDSAFDAQSGFFRRVGDTQLQGRSEWNWYGQQGALIESVSFPQVEFRTFWDHQDFWAGRGVEEAQVQVGSRISLRNNFTLWGNHQRTYYSFGGDDYQDLFTAVGDGLVPFRPDQGPFENLGSTSIGFWANSWERVRGNARVSFRETPVFGGEQGVAVEPASELEVDGSVNLYLTRSFQTELGLRHSTLSLEDGTEYSTATIPRIRAQYQFSRALFARTIFEYASQERAALRDPRTGLPLVECDGEDCDVSERSDNHDVHFEALVTYEPSPGTVFYVGYTREMEDTRAFRFQDVRPVADGLFVKLSYRFRF